MKTMASQIRLFIFGLLFAAGCGGLFFPAPAAVAAGSCFCFENLTKLTAETVKDQAQFIAQCSTVAAQSDCTKEKNSNTATSKRFFDCNYAQTDDICQAALKGWEQEKTTRLKELLGTTEGAEGGASQPSTIIRSRLIPDCALQNELTDQCRSVNIFITLAIKITQYLFSIIGGVSLVMFVYGGFILILSQGNEEKISQAKDILVAVVIGLLIAFGGYILIKFLASAVGVDPEFILK